MCSHSSQVVQICVKGFMTILVNRAKFILRIVYQTFFTFFRACAYIYVDRGKQTTTQTM